MIISAGGVYTLKQAEGVLKDLQRAIQAEKDAMLGPYVHVKFCENPNHYKNWTYRDPSGLCRQGDMALVDVAGVLKPVMVVGLGRGKFTGYVEKSILGRYQYESLNAPSDGGCHGVNRS